MKSIILFILFIFAAGHLAAAQVPYATEDSISLQGQYQMMLKRSKTLESYKLINPYRLSVVWKNAMDSLTVEKRKVRELRTANTLQGAKLDSQATRLTQQQKILVASQNRVDEMSLLGYPVNKSIYNAVVWGLVVVLALAFTFVFLHSAGYRKEARYRVQLCDELTEEFQSYKVKSNEKEKKLARELQDERNKLDELTKR